jgi:hypothetical protein
VLPAGLFGNVFFSRGFCCRLWQAGVFSFYQRLKLYPAWDYFFTYLTYLGDGIIWVPLFLYVLLYKRHYFMMVLASLVICTFLTHFLKRVVLPMKPGRYELCMIGEGGAVNEWEGCLC